MRVSVYAQFTLKDSPKDRRGMRGESWNFGKDKPLAFDQLAYALVSRLAQFFYAAGAESADQLNAELKKLAAGLEVSEFREQPETDDGHVEA